MKYLILFFSFVLCGSFSSSELFRLGDFAFSDSYFFSVVPKGEWELLSNDKKVFVFNDFLKKELVFFDATETGLVENPLVKSKLLRRFNILLINNTYEHLVARPLVSSFDYDKNKKNLRTRALIHHLLISFKETGGSRSKKEALSFCYQLRDSLSVTKNKLVLFGELAVAFSDDPSAKQNQGRLGWVSWGAVVDDFQSPVFALPKGGLSDPILTDFGFHLAFVENYGFSDYYYYPQKHFNDVVYKASLRSLGFDDLKSRSASFDSLLFKESLFVLNDSLIAELFVFVDKQKTLSRLSGSRASLMGFVSLFKEARPNGVLFIKKGKAFGLGWFHSRLSNTPATRVSSINNPSDLSLLIKGLVLEDLVVERGFLMGVDSSFSFNYDLLKNYKNIVFNEYISSLLNSVSVDSSLVVDFYNSGVYNNDFKNPRKVLVSEIRVSSLVLAKEVFGLYLNGSSFDFLLKNYGGGVREPIGLGRGNLLGEAAFALSVGGVSDIIENNDGSFSIIRVDSFIEETIFSLQHVYSQIERKIIKEKQENIKSNLLDVLLKKHQPVLVLGPLGL